MSSLYLRFISEQLSVLSPEYTCVLCFEEKISKYVVIDAYAYCVGILLALFALLHIAVVLYPCLVVSAVLG